MISLVMWDLKYGTNNLSTKQEQTHRHKEQTCAYQERDERNRSEVWV